MWRTSPAWVTFTMIYFGHLGTSVEMDFKSCVHCWQPLRENHRNWATDHLKSLKWFTIHYQDPNIFKPFHKQKGRQVSHFPHGILPLADWNKQQYWESLDFWWEQLINLCSGPVCWKQEASLHGKSSQLWWSSLQTPCFWLHPFLSSNPHFVRTSAIDALLIPLHPNQSSPTPEDTGFHPK